MPWVRARLRGQLIYARASETGALQAENGRVEIRYKPNDGRRYEAREGNLEVVPGPPLPDDTCGPADAVRKPEKGAASGEAAVSGASAVGASPAAGTRSRAASGRAAAGPAPIPEGAIVAYADGACSGNPGPAGLGVTMKDGARTIELSEYLGVGTNNIAELTAILRVLQEIQDATRGVVIFTDSQYSIGVLQKGWKAKANVELVAELRNALKARKNTQIRYVPGHAGHAGNERADALAREAVRARKSRRTEQPPTA
ncbi:ribonuclease HI [Chondromyces apiculatus]|uniref:ribonuclease HI n=1 Tax=Chondromyces apiculatus TaxID=51 RepID=UPI000693F6CD|nr:ribonuclease H [Chondromyces apiculatus]